MFYGIPPLPPCSETMKNVMMRNHGKTFNASPASCREVTHNRVCRGDPVFCLTPGSADRPPLWTLLPTPRHVCTFPSGPRARRWPRQAGACPSWLSTRTRFASSTTAFRPVSSFTPRQAAARPSCLSLRPFNG